MIKVHVTNIDGLDRNLELAEDSSARSVADELQKETPYTIVSCRVNNRNESLNITLRDGDDLCLLDIRDSSAYMTYQSSLSFLYIKAVHDVLGSSVGVSICNSLSKGLFTLIKTNGITDQTAKAIQWHMEELVKEDLPINSRSMQKEEILDFLSEHNRQEQLRLVKSAEDLKEANLYQLENEEEIFYHNLVPSTSYLKYFEVRRYKNGMLLRFPNQLAPTVIRTYEEQKILYDAFSEATRWGRILNVNYAADLNEKIVKGEFKDLVLLSEALHEKKIAEIAEMIHKAGKRIILIAGPSSSGKTTFANRLCIQLRVIGLRPLYLGTDDYFKERDETPLLENGEKDYESLRAIDTDLFTNNMNDLLQGKKVDLPYYDFIEGKKIYGTRITSIDHNQPIVIEGIHGLNPELTKNIDDEEKFRIYISPLTQLSIDTYNRIPTTDTRLLRRMVRDNLHRGYDASHTIKSWPLVREGEEKYIFPYSDWADVFFNSNSIYELSILKKYAQPLLSEIKPDSDAYPQAQRMLEFLNFFVAANDESAIPNNSIIREFIGGSILV